jgi:hypothetical protein
VADLPTVPASTWLTYETINRSQHELDWRQLHAFFREDFRKATSGEFAKIFDEDASRLEAAARHLALVPYYAKAKARPYVRPPLREFTTGSALQSAKLQDTYRASKIDTSLLSATQMAWALNSVVLSFDPPSSPTKIRTRRHIPADVLVHGDPALDDIRGADTVEIRWPISSEQGSSTVFVHYGRAVYTREHAYIENASGDKVGIYQDDLRHPLGYIPLVAGRLTEAEDGLFFPAPPGDVLSLQIGMILAATDMETIVRMKASPREFLLGGGAETKAERISASPFGVNGLSGSELAYAAESLDPRIDRYREALEFTFNNWAMMRQLNPDGLWASRGITGAAKEVEQAEILEDLARQEQLWRELEQDLVEVVSDVSRLGPSALSVRDPRVEVAYRYFEARQNDLQEAQSLALFSALGAESTARWMAMRHNIPVEAAQERMMANLAERQQVLETWRPPADIEPPPGLDAIAEQVVRP